MIFDTHTHYDDEAFDSDREELITGLPRKGVGTVVTVGADMATSRAALELAGRYENVYAAIGVHPSETHGMTEQDLTWLRAHAADQKVVAVGEIGLDYHWKDTEPVIYHSREAAEDTMKIICQTKAYECGGVIHCYSYAKEMALEYVKMGYFIGVGGVVTFKNGRKLKETVEAVPIEHIVLETDCPYLSPEPYRGKRNDSSKLGYVVDEIARIKGMTAEEVIDITEQNARRLYRLDKRS